MPHILSKAPFLSTLTCMSSPLHLHYCCSHLDYHLLLQLLTIASFLVFLSLIIPFSGLSSSLKMKSTATLKTSPLVYTLQCLRITNKEGTKLLSRALEVFQDLQTLSFPPFHIPERLFHILWNFLIFSCAQALIILCVLFFFFYSPFKTIQQTHFPHCS